VRSRTQRWPLGDANEIAAVATSLLDSIDVDRGVRLIGVSVSNLTAKAPHAVQLGLFAASDEEPEDHGQASDGREGAAEVAADEIRRKFGHQAITSVAAAERRAARERRRGGDQR